MDAARILQEFETHGVVLRADGEKVYLRPRGAAPRGLIEEARRCKAELLSILSGSLMRERISSSAHNARLSARSPTAIWYLLGRSCFKVIPPNPGRAVCGSSERARIQSLAALDAVLSATSRGSWRPDSMSSKRRFQK